MSKGHATVGQYPILNDLGYPKKDWNNWGKIKTHVSKCLVITIFLALRQLLVL